MRQLTYTRRAYMPDYTLGEFDNGLVGVEKAWIGNQPFISCIPEGRYVMTPYSSSRFDMVYELHGVPERSKILIHCGNTSADVKGCIAIGKSFSMTSGMISQSRHAMDEFREDIGDQRIELIITSYRPEYP